MKPVPFLMLSLIVCGCAPRADDVTPNDSTHRGVHVGPDSARGTVVVTGVRPTPYATLSTGEESPIILAGPLEPELRQLAGAQVAVFGERTDGQRASMRVDRYDILVIDGARPVVGTILPDGRLVAGDDTLFVLGHTGPLPAGATVWIVGRRDGAGIRLLSWGLIRSP